MKWHRGRKSQSHAGEKLREILTAELTNRDKWEKRLKRDNKNWKDVYLTENAMAEITSELSGDSDEMGAGEVRTKLIRYRRIKITLAHQALLNSLNIPGKIHDEIFSFLMGQ